MLLLILKESLSALYGKSVKSNPVVDKPAKEDAILKLIVLAAPASVIRLTLVPDATEVKLFQLGVVV